MKDGAGQVAMSIIFHDQNFFIVLFFNHSLKKCN